MGKPIPDRIYNEPAVWRQGLKLRRGPDPRLYNAGLAVATAVGREMFGLDTWNVSNI
jgi:hypothetical protein